MTSARITFATIFVLIASALTGQTQWKYRTTNDGEYHIGTNGPNVCVETNSISVTFTVPQGWRISEPKSDETGCKFTLGQLLTLSHSPLRFIGSYRQTSSIPSSSSTLRTSRGLRARKILFRSETVGVS